MSPTPRLNSLGAAELTQKFKKETEKLVKDSSRTEPWVLLQPQRPRWVPNVLEVDTSLEVEASASVNEERGMLSPSEKSTVGKYMKGPIENQIIPSLPSFNAESSLKLHALCSSSSSSIEMIRIYASTYPWTLRQKDCSGDLPLHVAIKREDTSYMVICELLQRSPDTARVKDKNGNLPLFLACRRPKVSVNVLRALIQIYPAAVHIKSYGNTCLHHLLHTGNASPENVNLLISYNHDAVWSQNNFGNLPLHYLCASENPHILTVRSILECFPEGITSINKAGETPIQRALAKNNDESMRERVRLMLKASCSNALSRNQRDLLKELNWEARRIVILLCVNLARRSIIPLVSSNTDICKECHVLMDVYHICKGVWRDIIAYL